MTRLFISYARQDAEHVKDFLAHLESLRRSGKIGVWHDQQIEPGKVWDDEIKTALSNSDIVVFLLSADLLASDYVYNVELSIAYERHQRGEIVIVPVMLRKCTTWGTVFEHLQGLPAGNEPVLSRKWHDKDHAFTDVVEGLMRIVERLSGAAPAAAKPPGAEETGVEGPPARRLTLRLPSLNPAAIVGRDTELAQLRQKLLSDSQVLVVNGIGGIGKTTLAQAYLGRWMTAYRHVAWITLVSGDAMSDIAGAEGLADTLGVARQGKDVQELFREVMRALHAFTELPCLLILDNAGESLAGIKDYLPVPPGWHVLATSRAQIHGFAVMELGFLPAGKAAELFRKHCTLYSDAEVAALVKQVDYHTLTIEILAKVAQHRKPAAAALKRAIADDLQAGVQLPHNPRGKIDRVRSYLCSIFDLSGLNDGEQWMMKQFACLPAEFHSYELLMELAAPGEEQRDTFAATLDDLAGQGWLICNRDSKNNTEAYKMHKVVQEVARRQLRITEEDAAGLLRQLTQKLRIDQARDNPVDKFPWAPFGLALFEVFADSDSVSVALLQSELAMVLRQLGQYEQSRELRERVVRSYEKNYGPNHEYTATSYANLALTLRSLGQYEQARELLQKAVILAEKNFGSDHPTTAIRYSNLASVLQDLGQYEQARDLLQKAMISDEKNFGPDHPNTATRYSNLATVLQDLGQYEQARELLQKAMISDETNFGPEHPTTTICYSNLAMMLQDLGQYEQARELLQKTMISAEKNFGPDHPTTAIRYSNLATVLQDLGQYEQASELLQKAMISAEKNFGPEHPTTALRFWKLATALQNMGRRSEALVLAERAYQVLAAALPAGHPYISGTQRTIAGLKNELR